MSVQPDLEQIITVWWGGSYQSAILPGIIQLASNFVYGSNPAYTADMFLAMYPKFGGPPTFLSGVVTATSPTVENITTSLTGLAPGQLISNTLLLPGNTLIASLNATAQSLALSQAAIATNAAGLLTVYVSPLIPLPVLNVFIALASDSLNAGRWAEKWIVGMGFYIAHYCTLWLQSEGNPTSIPGQVAMSGLARGMQTSKSADGVSASAQNLMGEFGDWGAWNLTTYGQQYATMANIVGWGTSYIW